MGRDHFVVGPEVVYRKVFPAEIEIKEALAGVFAAIEGSQDFHLVLDLAFQGVPPRPAGAKLDAKGGAHFGPSEINGDFGAVAFVPTQPEGRSSPAGIR